MLQANLTLQHPRLPIGKSPAHPPADGGDGSYQLQLEDDQEQEEDCREGSVE
jgi:hypothetical protein